MLRRNINSKVEHKKSKGQSTVEYLILVAAVIAALLFFLKPGGLFQKAYNSTLITGTNGMEDMAGRLRSSRPMICNGKVFNGPGTSCP